MKELILLPLYRLIHCWERRLGTAMRRTMLPPWKIVEALSENPELIGKSRYDLRRISNLIDPEYWFWLLARHPQFAEYFDWFSHRNDSGLNWSELLSRQPGFADKCNWEAVCRLDLIVMYFRCPKIIKERFPDGNVRELTRYLTPREISTLLGLLPEAETLFDWEKIAPAMDENLWLMLLSKQPQFELHFNWDRVKGRKLLNWGALLKRRPQFARYCDFPLLDRSQLRTILLHQIQLRDRCDLGKLSDDDCKLIRKRHPEFRL